MFEADLVSLIFDRFDSIRFDICGARTHARTYENGDGDGDAVGDGLDPTVVERALPAVFRDLRVVFRAVFRVVCRLGDLRAGRLVGLGLERGRLRWDLISSGGWCHLI